MQVSAAGIGRALEDTLENLLGIGKAFPAETVAEWAARARSALAAQTELLECRRLAGKVRACHGDLQLRNICVLDSGWPLRSMRSSSDAIGLDRVLYDLRFR